MTLRTRRPRTRPQPWLLGLLLCACLIAQTLGLAHRVQHGGVGSPAMVAMVADANAVTVAASTGAALAVTTDKTAAAPAATALTATAATAPQSDGHLHLFAGHAHASDCQLYDHLGVAELLAGAPVLAMVAVRAPLAVARVWRGIVAGTTLGFQARAPPVLR